MSAPSGMMFPFWALSWPVLVLFPSSSAADRCPVRLHESSSALLDSLLCYNNYRSYVHCEWTQARNMSVQLWFNRSKNSRSPCVSYSTPERDASEPRIVQCRHKENIFAIGVKHTVFFLADKTDCQRTPVNLSQHLRTRPPVNLSAHDDGDGGCRVSWSEPYPHLSSLNEDVAYQLSYRRDGGDAWTTENVSGTSVRLEKQLSRGCEFQARVRARVSAGRWSDWTPMASAQTQKDVSGGRPPGLQCVLVGEKEVKCSWEVRADVSQVVTHQLLCRRNRTAPPESCCVNHSVKSDPGGQVLKHSCSLTAADPGNLLLELVPRQRAKTFMANRHIRPEPPEQVTVIETGRNWEVKWINPNRQSKFQVWNQLCYYRKREEECSFQNFSMGTMTWKILQASLVPSQVYQVKVRSFVVPGDKSIYGGIPSEWSGPAIWTSHEATWSPSTLIYFFISMFAATFFFILYCAVTACQRKMILWVDSIPTPGKSKIMSEIEVAKGQTQTLMKKSLACKNQHFDSVSTCSTDVYLWPNKDGKWTHSHQDDGCWECDNQPFICDHNSRSDSSGMGFSGLYILCWESQLNEDRLASSSSEVPAALNFATDGRDYVCLPPRNLSGSTGRHFFLCDFSANPHQDQGEQQQCPPDPGEMAVEAEDEPDRAEPLSEDPSSSSSSSSSPPAYTSEPFTGWPQGVSVQASGYCQLPKGHV